MILRQFSSRQPYLLLVTPLITLSILLPAWSWGFISFSFSDFPLDRLLQPLLQISFVGVSVASAFIIFGALLANIVFNRHEFNASPTFVPALVYSLIATTLCLIKCNIPVLVANVAVIIGLNRLMEVFRQSNALPAYFKAAFWLGLGALAFPPFILLLPAMLLSILNTRSFNWREHLLTIIAFIAPFIYWAVWMLWTDRFDDLILFKKTLSFNTPEGMPDWTNNYIGSFAIVTGSSFLLALRSFIFLSDRSSNQARNVKRIFLLIALFALASTGFSFVYVGQLYPEVIILPATFVIGNWFTNYRYSLLAPIMFYVLMTTAALLIIHVFQWI
ncbi:MAG: hypothetical protein ACK50N_03370 [Flavobacteriales bacterium]|jgi:hypothetical protein